MTDVKEVPVGMLAGCVIGGIIGTLVVQSMFLPDPGVHAEKQIAEVEKKCEFDKEGLQEGIANYKEREAADHAKIDKLESDLQMAEDQAKYWEDKRKSRVDVPEWARPLWLECAERWKTCDWDSAVIEKRVKKDGHYEWQVYNKCEVELNTCDRLMDSVTDPRGF